MSLLILELQHLSFLFQYFIQRFVLVIVVLVCFVLDMVFRCLLSAFISFLLQTNYLTSSQFLWLSLLLSFPVVVNVVCYFIDFAAFMIALIVIFVFVFLVQKSLRALSLPQSSSLLSLTGRLCIRRCVVDVVPVVVVAAVIAIVFVNILVTTPTCESHHYH